MSEQIGVGRVAVALRSDLDSGRATFSVVVQAACEDALSDGEAIENVSLWLDDGTVFENVKVEAIRGSVLFVGAHGGEVQEVNADSVIRMVVGAARGVLCGGVSR
ncbi:hypothetical protein [Rhodococcus qingshengii]|uniref:hypothetical protein n=1 Tax=Rhodococcus qingshengii TaxID=334542 RepID=UPI0021B130B8|nr:hypothetical protein [Rhodococcus qingshengii]MCT6735536.1 hypothetical protein [Rhodococcus qingshengii]